MARWRGARVASASIEHRVGLHRPEGAGRRLVMTTVDHHAAARVQLGTVAPPLFGAVEGQVDQDLAGVGHRVLHGADSRPAASQFEQALLDEILGRGRSPATR